MNPYHIRPIIWAIRAGIAFIISYAFIFVVLNLATCRPFWARWQRMNGEWALTHNFTCMDDGLVGPVSAALSAISDAYTVIVPLVILLRLNLPFRAKIGPYTVFAFGFIAVGAGIARTVYLVRVYQGAPGSVCKFASTSCPRTQLLTAVQGSVCQFWSILSVNSRLRCAAHARRLFAKFSFSSSNQFFKLG